MTQPDPKSGGKDRRGHYILKWTALIAIIALMVTILAIRTADFPEISSDDLSWIEPPKQQTSAKIDSLEIDSDTGARLSLTINAVSTIPATTGEGNVAPDENAKRIAKGESLKTVMTLVTLFVAFIAACMITIGVVWCRSDTGKWLKKRPKWLPCADILTVAAAIAGLAFVFFDPFGVRASLLIGHSSCGKTLSDTVQHFPPLKPPLTILEMFSAACADSHKETLSNTVLLQNIAAAQKPSHPAPPVTMWTIAFVNLVIYLSGALAGVVVSTVVLFLSYVGGDGAESSQGVKPEGDLQKRKENLAMVVTTSSIALSLGVAIIHTFLNWGTVFLNENGRKIIEPVASAGASYWGTMFLIFTVLVAGLAAYQLHKDIAEAAKTNTKKATPKWIKEQKTPAEWIKEHNLEFDPLKTVSTILVALGPILTSTVMTALSKGVS